VTGDGIDALLRALMRHIEDTRESLASDVDLSAAEAALDAEIASDVLRQSLARRPQRPLAHDIDVDDDDDTDVDVIYRAD